MSHPRRFLTALLGLVTLVSVFALYAPSEADAVALKPLADRVLVQVEDGGAYLSVPPSQPGISLGEIEAVGPGAFAELTGGRIPMELNEGDSVVFSMEDAVKILVNGSPYYVVHESDVLAVIG